MIIEGKEGWKQFTKTSFHSSYFQVMKTEGEEIHQKAEKQLCTPAGLAVALQLHPGGGHLWLCQ